MLTSYGNQLVTLHKCLGFTYVPPDTEQVDYHIQPWYTTPQKKTLVSRRKVIGILTTHGILSLTG